MQYATIRERRTGKCRVRTAPGRGLFFHFNHALDPDPTAERVAVHAGPDLFRSCPRAFWPDIEAGVREGFDATCASGVRLCCTRLTISSVVYHDLDTLPEGVRLRLKCFVRDRLTEVVQPIDPFPAKWLTSTVAELARGIHADRAFDRLPILADALQDAGCADPLVIEHLQTCPDHAPSCWVVEMILGRLAAC
jgi:hypothetical protein